MLLSLSDATGAQYTIVTIYGLKVAFFYSKVTIRILRPGWAALADDKRADIPRPIGAILNKLDHEVDHLCDDAQLRAYPKSTPSPRYKQMES